MSTTTEPSAAVSAHTPQTDAIQDAFNERNGMSVDDIIEAYEHARGLERKVSRLLAALHEISEGKGRFSRDPLTHASNTIDDMKALAITAIAAATGK